MIRPRLYLALALLIFAGCDDRRTGENDFSESDTHNDQRYAKKEVEREVALIKAGHEKLRAAYIQSTSHATETFDDIQARLPPKMSVHPSSYPIPDPDPSNGAGTVGSGPVSMPSQSIPPWHQSWLEKEVTPYFAQLEAMRMPFQGKHFKMTGEPWTTDVPGSYLIWELRRDDGSLIQWRKPVKLVR